MGSCDHLEKAQRRATKIVPKNRDLTYEQRMRRLKLPSLTYRRKRGDMIQVYKILYELEDTPIDTFFTKLIGNTRGHSKRLFKPRCTSSLRQNSFRHRVINDWNNLPEHVVTAPSINAFKSRIDKVWKDKQYLWQKFMAAQAAKNFTICCILVHGSQL